MILLEDFEQVVWNAPLKVYEWNREKREYELVFDETIPFFDKSNFPLEKGEIEEYSKKFYQFMQAYGNREVYEVVPQMDENCNLSIGVFLDL